MQTSIVVARGSVVVAPGLTSSVVGLHRFSCPAACGVFADQGSNLCLLHWQMDSLPLSHQGSPEVLIIKEFGFVFFFCGLKTVFFFSFMPLSIIPKIFLPNPQ